MVGLVMVFALTGGVLWGRSGRDANLTHVARIGRTRALLNDGACTFAAAVMLRPDADVWTVERRQFELREAFVALLRTKSRYMVSTATAREALRRQMLREVNRVMAAPVADDLRFTEFVLS